MYTPEQYEFGRKYREDWYSQRGGEGIHWDGLPDRDKDRWVNEALNGGQECC